MTSKYSIGLLSRGMAILMCFCLLSTSCNVAQAANIAPEIFATVSNLPQFRLTPPGRMGRIADYYNAPTKDSKLVVLIQDLHAHYGVQKNISGILEELSKKLSSDKSNVPFALAVEGAEGPIDSSVLALFPDQKIKAQAADYLMREGELTGAEHFAVMRGIPDLLVGVENNQYYNLNRELFRKTLADREELVGLLKGLQADIAPLQDHLYGGPLNDFQKKVAGYDNGELSTHDFIGLLVQKTGDINIRRDFPTLASFSSNSRFGTMEQVRAATAEFLTQTQSLLTPEEKKNLQSLAKNGSTTPYYLYMRDLVYKKKLFLATPPELAQYLEYIHTAQTMGMDRVTHEAKELAFRIKLQLGQSSQEKDLIQVEHDLDLLTRISDLQATELEVKGFGPRLNQFMALCKSLMESSGIHSFDESKVRGLISSSIDYYALALMRNKPMMENTLSMIGVSPMSIHHDVHKAHHSKLKRTPNVITPRKRYPDTAVLVAGGFHTASLTELLRQKNVSYIVISPSVDKIAQADHDLYVKRLSGNLLTMQDVLADAKGWSSSTFAQSSKMGVAANGLTPGILGKSIGIGVVAMIFVGILAHQTGQIPDLPSLDLFTQRYSAWANHFQDALLSVKGLLAGGTGVAGSAMAMIPVLGGSLDSWYDPEGGALKLEEFESLLDRVSEAVSTSRGMKIEAKLFGSTRYLRSGNRSGSDTDILIILNAEVSPEVRADIAKQFRELMGETIPGSKIEPGQYGEDSHVADFTLKVGPKFKRHVELIIKDTPTEAIDWTLNKFLKWVTMPRAKWADMDRDPLQDLVAAEYWIGDNDVYLQMLQDFRAIGGRQLTHRILFPKGDLIETRKRFLEKWESRREILRERVQHPDQNGWRVIQRFAESVNGVVKKSDIVGDVSIAAEGERAALHADVNRAIETFRQNGQEKSLTLVDRFRSAWLMVKAGEWRLALRIALGYYTIHLYGDDNTAFLTGRQTTHAGISTGAIHLARGEYLRLKTAGDRYLAGRIAHEAKEISLWRQEARRRGQNRQSMREWIKSNLDMAKKLDQEFHISGVNTERAVSGDEKVGTYKGSEDPYDVNIQAHFVAVESRGASQLAGAMADFLNRLASGMRAGAVRGAQGMNDARFWVQYLGLSPEDAQEAVQLYIEAHNSIVHTRLRWEAPDFLEAVANELQRNRKPSEKPELKVPTQGLFDRLRQVVFPVTNNIAGLLANRRIPLVESKSPLETLAQEVLGNIDDPELRQLYTDILGQLKNDHVVLTSPDGASTTWDKESVRRVLLFVKDVIEIMNEIPEGILDRSDMKMPLTIQSIQAFGQVANGKVIISIKQHEKGRTGAKLEIGSDGVTNKNELRDTVIHEVLGHKLTFQPSQYKQGDLALPIETWREIAKLVSGLPGKYLFTKDYIEANVNRLNRVGTVEPNFSIVTEAIAYALTGHAESPYVIDQEVYLRIRALLSQHYLIDKEGRSWEFNADRRNMRWTQVNQAQRTPRYPLIRRQFPGGSQRIQKEDESLEPSTETTDGGNFGFTAIRFVAAVVSLWLGIPMPAFLVAPTQKSRPTAITIKGGTEAEQAQLRVALKDVANRVPSEHYSQLKRIIVLPIPGKISAIALPFLSGTVILSSRMFHQENSGRPIFPVAEIITHELWHVLQSNSSEPMRLWREGTGGSPWGLLTGPIRIVLPMSAGVLTFALLPFSLPIWLLAIAAGAAGLISIELSLTVVTVAMHIVWRLFGESYATKYAIWNRSEDGAETYRYYFYHSDELKQRAQLNESLKKRFKTMENIVQLASGASSASDSKVIKIIGAMHAEIGEDSKVAAQRLEALRRWLRMKGVDIEVWANQQATRMSDYDRTKVREALTLMGLSDEQIKMVTPFIILADVPDRIRLEGNASRIGGLIIDTRLGPKILFPKDRIKYVAQDREHLADLLHEVVEIGKLHQGLTVDQAHDEAMEARRQFLAGDPELSKVFDGLFTGSARRMLEFDGFGGIWAEEAANAMQIGSAYLMDSTPQGGKIYGVVTARGDHYAFIVDESEQMIGVAAHEDAMGAYGVTTMKPNPNRYMILNPNMNPIFQTKWDAYLAQAQAGNVTIPDRQLEWGSVRRTDAFKAKFFFPLINRFYGLPELRSDFIDNVLIRHVIATVKPSTLLTFQGSLYLIDGNLGRYGGAISFGGHTVYDMHSHRTMDDFPLHHIQRVVHELTHEIFNEMPAEARDRVMRHFLDKRQDLASALRQSPAYRNNNDYMIVSEMVAQIVGNLAEAFTKVMIQDEAGGRHESYIRGEDIDVLIENGFLPKSFAPTPEERAKFSQNDGDIGLQYLSRVYPQARLHRETRTQMGGNEKVLGAMHEARLPEENKEITAKVDAYAELGLDREKLAQMIWVEAKVKEAKEIVKQAHRNLANQQIPALHSTSEETRARATELMTKLNKALKFVAWDLTRVAGARRRGPVPQRGSEPSSSGENTVEPSVPGNEDSQNFKAKLISLVEEEIKSGGSNTFFEKYHELARDMQGQGLSIEDIAIAFSDLQLRFTENIETSGGYVQMARASILSYLNLTPEDITELEIVEIRQLVKNIKESPHKKSWKVLMEKVNLILTGGRQVNDSEQARELDKELLTALQLLYQAPLTAKDMSELTSHFHSELLKRPFDSHLAGRLLGPVWISAMVSGARRLGKVDSNIESGDRRRRSVMLFISPIKQNIQQEQMTKNLKRIRESLLLDYDIRSSILSVWMQEAAHEESLPEWIKNAASILNSNAHNDSFHASRWVRSILIELLPIENPQALKMFYDENKSSWEEFQRAKSPGEIIDYFSHQENIPLSYDYHLPMLKSIQRNHAVLKEIVASQSVPDVYRFYAVHLLALEGVDLNWDSLRDAAKRMVRWSNGVLSDSDSYIALESSNEFLKAMTTAVLVYQDQYFPVRSELTRKLAVNIRSAQWLDHYSAAGDERLVFGRDQITLETISHELGHQYLALLGYHNKMQHEWVATLFGMTLMQNEQFPISTVISHLMPYAVAVANQDFTAMEEHQGALAQLAYASEVFLRAGAPFQAKRILELTLNHLTSTQPDVLRKAGFPGVVRMVLTQYANDVHNEIDPVKLQSLMDQDPHLGYAFSDNLLNKSPNVLSPRTLLTEILQPATALVDTATPVSGRTVWERTLLLVEMLIAGIQRAVGLDEIKSNLGQYHTSENVPPEQEQKDLLGKATELSQNYRQAFLRKTQLNMSTVGQFGTAVVTLFWYLNPKRAWSQFHSGWNLMFGKKAETLNPARYQAALARELKQLDPTAELRLEADVPGTSTGGTFQTEIAADGHVIYHVHVSARGIADIEGEILLHELVHLVREHTGEHDRLIQKWGQWIGALIEEFMTVSTVSHLHEEDPNILARTILPLASQAEASVEALALPDPAGESSTAQGLLAGIQNLKLRNAVLTLLRQKRKDLFTREAIATAA